jgi:hypothetical protein
VTPRDTRYEMGEAHPHALVGFFAPDLALVTEAGQGRLADRMHGARGVWLELRDRPALRRLASAYKGRVHVVAARCASATTQADAILIRPDGYAAWAAGETESDAAAGESLERALGTWFGALRA